MAKVIRCDDEPIRSSSIIIYCRCGHIFCFCCSHLMSNERSPLLYSCCWCLGAPAHAGPARPEANKSVSTDHTVGKDNFALWMCHVSSTPSITYKLNKFIYFVHLLIKIFHWTLVLRPDRNAKERMIRFGVVATLIYWTLSALPRGRFHFAWVCWSLGHMSFLSMAGQKWQPEMRRRGRFGKLVQLALGIVRLPHHKRKVNQNMYGVTGRLASAKSPGHHQNHPQCIPERSHTGVLAERWEPPPSPRFDGASFTVSPGPTDSRHIPNCNFHSWCKMHRPGHKSNRIKMK